MIEDSGPAGKPRRLLDLFSGVRTVRYYSHFGTHPSRVPEKFSSFLSSAYRSAFCNPFAFRFMQEWVGVYPHPRMFSRDFPTFQLWLTNCSKRVSVGKVRWNPNLPSSVHTSKFRIPQPLCLPLLRKHRGCPGILPILELSLLPTFGRSDVSITPI